MQDATHECQNETSHESREANTATTPPQAKSYSFQAGATTQTPVERRAFSYSFDALDSEPEFLGVSPKPVQSEHERKRQYAHLQRRQ